MIFSSERNGRLDIVNLLLQRTNRFVVREFFILLMITNGELAETRDRRTMRFLITDARGCRRCCLSCSEQGGG